ncbi:MAG: pilus assembly protein TadG-related protein, partial [Planctomycetota bacterium]
MKHILSNRETLRQNRRGIAILWLIIWGSLFLTFFCGVLEVATLWQAQVEVNNALDSAALAAAKEWGISGSGSTQIPRDVGVAYFAANPILGSSAMLTTNYTPAVPGNPNGNATCFGNFLFGSLSSTVAPIIFDSGAQGGCVSGDVTITINKPLAGTGVTANEMEVTFNDADPGLTIESIEFILPTTAVNNVQRPYFDASKDPQVSQVPADFNGLNVASNGVNWSCPNGIGDICFEFPPPEIGGLTDRYQSVRINFAPGSF